MDSGAVPIDEALAANFQETSIQRMFAMRPHAPSSRAYFRVRISAIDASFAILSPLVALVLRDAPILSDSYSLYFYFYWACCTFFSLISFLIFRLEQRAARYFSVDDIFDIVKAVVVAELLTAIALFSFTRLDGIPRSTLFIHSLILAAALIAARTVAHLFEYEQKRAYRRPTKTKYVIVVASNYFSSGFIKWLETNDIEPKQVIAILDDSEEMKGRKIAGVQILGSPLEIRQTVDEFVVHGVNVDEVIVSGSENHLAKPVLAELSKTCRQMDIELTFMPQLFQSTFRQLCRSERRARSFSARAGVSSTRIFWREANLGFRFRVDVPGFAVTCFCMRQCFGGSRCWNSSALLAAEVGRRGPSLPDLQI